MDSRCLLQMVTEWYFPVTEILSMVFHVSEIFQWHFRETRLFQCYKWSPYGATTISGLSLVKTLAVRVIGLVAKMASRVFINSFAAFCVDATTMKGPCVVLVIE